MRSSPSFLRDEVFDRDRGVCSKCGLDTEQFVDDMRRLLVQSVTITTQAKPIGGALGSGRTNVVTLIVKIAGQPAGPSLVLSDDRHQMTWWAGHRSYVRLRDAIMFGAGFHAERSHRPGQGRCHCPYCVESRRTGYRWGKHYWEADHVDALGEGGEICGLEGMRTLCVPCHKVESALLVARLAQARRREKARNRPWEPRN